VPFVTFQYATLGRTVGGKEVTRGWKDQDPIVEEMFVILT